MSGRIFLYVYDGNLFYLVNNYFNAIRKWSSDKSRLKFTVVWYTLVIIFILLFYLLASKPNNILKQFTRRTAGNVTEHWFYVWFLGLFERIVWKDCIVETTYLSSHSSIPKLSPGMIKKIWWKFVSSDLCYKLIQELNHKGFI